MRIKNTHPSTTLMTIFERDDHSPHHHSLTCFLHRCTTATVDFRIWTPSGHGQCYRNGMCCATVWTVLVGKVLFQSLASRWWTLTYRPTSVSLRMNDWLQMQNQSICSIYLLEKLGKSKEIIWSIFVYLIHEKIPSRYFSKWLSTTLMSNLFFLKIYTSRNGISTRQRKQKVW